MSATGGSEKDLSGQKRTGVVKWFSFSRGYGFITEKDSNAEYFVHQSNIVMEGFRSLRLGEAVEFGVCEDKGRVKAIDVTGPGGQQPLGAPPRPPQDADNIDSPKAPGRGRGRGGRGRGRGRGNRGAAARPSTQPDDSNTDANHAVPNPSASQ